MRFLINAVVLRLGIGHDKNLNPRVQAVIDRQAEYLLRMINLCNEIYRFTFNDKSQFHDTDVEAAISAMN